MVDPKGGRRPVIFIFITVLIDSVGFGLILPVLPQLIVELTGRNMGGAAAYGGWLAFSYALVQFFAAPVLGGLSDRFGRRPVLLASLFALGVDYLVMGVAPTIGWLFLGRVVAGMAGASFTTAYAYLADVSTPDRRAQNFGLVGAAFGMGFIIGPAIGGLIGTLGPRAPFFAAATLALLNTAFGLFALPESLPPAARRTFEWSRANPLGTLLHLSKYPAVIWLLAAAFFWQLGHQVLPNVWSYYTIYKFHWSTAAVGASLAVAGIVMVLGQGVLIRWLIPRLGGDRPAAVLGMLFGAITYLGYAFSTQGWMMYVSLLAWLPAAVAYPSLNSLMSREIPPSAQGELQGGVASLYGLSSILGPPLMTGLFGYFTSDRTAYIFPGAPFVAAALLVIVSVLLLNRGLRPAAALDPRASTPLTTVSKESL